MAFVETMAKQQNKSKEVVEKEFFEHVRPSSLLKRFATVDEVAAMVTYMAERAFFGHQRRRAAGRWRRGQGNSLS